MKQTQPYQNVIERMNRAGYEGIPFLFALDYDQQHGLFIENPLEQTEVLFRIAECTNIADRPFSTNTHRVPLHKKPIPIEEYAKRFATIQDGMRKGLSLLANLTVRTPIETPLSLKEILFSTTAPYQLYVPSIPFVCFSPEQFVNISRDGLISTAPMKGTIASDTPGAPSSILNDYKETSEHCAVVDLLLRDLRGVAENVHVKRFRFFTEIPTQQDRKLYQVSSEICGTISGAWQQRIGTIFDRLLPAGSILGAPREETKKLIAAAEVGTPRGFYCGVFGCYNGNSVSSAVLIRFICEDKGGQKFYHSGGGITINSRMDMEYREVIEKIYLPQS